MNIFPPSFSEMEFYSMEARALKSSFRREVMAAPRQEEEEEEFVWLNDFNSIDDLSVDSFLDFSHGGLKDEPEPESFEEGDKDSVSVSNSSSVSFSDSFLSGELIPFHTEDLAELEWVSQFVDDSSSSSSSEVAGLLVAGGGTEPKPVFTTLPPPPFLNSRIPVRARTKRARPFGRTWFVSSDSSSSSPSSSASSSPCFFSAQRPPIHAFFAGEPLRKKQKKKPAVDSDEALPPAQQRKCSHCGIQKTPQWRSGPHGAKTLCNACGVRYKSGRLFPEYRPAGSPTFSDEMHSNSHRKVLEMRKRKEGGMSAATAVAGSDPAPTGTGF
ncbi:GATA transcription factor 3 [Linum grandiflorum]